MNRIIAYISATVTGLIVATIPFPARAQGTTTGFMDMTDLTLASSGGSVLWSGAWTLTQASYASADGVSVSGTTSATSAQANASTVATAPAFGTAGIFGLVLGQINSLPGSEPANAATSSTFTTSFVTSGSTQLTLGATISSILTAQAGLLSTVSYSDDLISIVVDNTPILAWSDSMNAAPNQTTPTDSETPTLSDGFTLANGTHALSITMETGQSINASAVPEPSITALLAAALLIFTFPIPPALKEVVIAKRFR